MVASSHKGALTDITNLSWRLPTICFQYWDLGCKFQTHMKLIRHPHHGPLNSIYEFNGKETFFPLFSWLYKYHRELLLHFVLLYCGCLGCEPVAAGRAPSFLLRAFWWSFRWGVSDITDAAYLVNSSVPFANCISGQLFH